MDCIITPSGKKLEDGTVVILARFPGTKWTVRNGKYSYEGKFHEGWYFASIPANTVIPVNPDDLTLLTVVSDTDGLCWGCLPPDTPAPPDPPRPQPGPQPGPRPPKPQPNQEIARLQSEIDRTFITVNTTLERDRLRFYSLIPDGKLVRVNHMIEIVDDEEVDTGVKYFRYDKETDTFIEISLENEVSGEEFTEVKEKVENLNDCLEWKYL